MVCLRLGIENHQIGVAADGDRSFARIEAEQLRRSGRNQFHKTVHTESSAGHAAGVDQAHAMLYARAAVRNFREIVAAHFFLFFETKRAMIGGDNLQVIVLEAVPEFLLMPFFAQRRSENIFRSFEPGCIKVLERKIQILRAGLGVDGKSAVARLANFFKRIVAA